MNKVFKTKNLTLYIYAALGLGLLMVWRGGGMVTQKLQEIPIKKLQRTIAKPGLVDTKSFYPVWVKQQTAIRAEAVAMSGPVDVLFKKPEDPKVVEAAAAAAAPKPITPDYVAGIRQNASVDGIADNGAIINGAFYVTGAPIESLSFMVVGKAPLIPVLESVGARSVVIKVGKVPVSVPLANVQFN